MFFIISNDKELRADGRAYDELRPIKIEAGVLKRADGSAYLEVGGNKILASVYGPRESYIRRLLKPNTGVIRVRYNMAPFSVDDRKRPGPDRRSTEISKIAADALRPALMLESFPRSMVDVSIEVIGEVDIMTLGEYPVVCVSGYPKPDNTGGNDHCNQCPIQIGQNRQIDQKTADVLQ